ncbi:creatininase family protein [Gordonia polyisoprenivorans]|uniref:creatininase family protein n=2 Tax=Gordonia polyisoprenivorans TaxID=84595 RepID=UPI0030CDA4DC
MDYLTSPEVAAAIESGMRTAVLPLGATEQHGPHLPLAMDALHADELAVRIARRLGNALVLPTVRVGYSPHHLGFAGSLSLRSSTLEAICEDYLGPLAGYGFERAIIFSAHIGNHPVMREFEQRLKRNLAPLSVALFTDGESIIDTWRRCTEQSDGLGANVGGHADIAETAVLLALWPEQVRSDAFECGYTGIVDSELLGRAFDEGIHSVSPNGILGDPRGATADLGLKCMEAVTSLIVEHTDARGLPDAESGPTATDMTNHSGDLTSP